MEYKSKDVVCQNCQTGFTIEPDDFGFYKKIKVPPPTFCPECRTIRRLTWRNEMSLFKRKTDVPNYNDIHISMYHPDEKLVTYDVKYWWSDKWDPMSYGKEYDFSESFFQQWGDLYRSFPLQILSNSNAINSDYCNVAEDSKDSYMCSASWEIERTLYSNRVTKVKDSADLYAVHRSELCYDDVICLDSYHLLYSLNCKSCVDSYFLYDCVGCVNCFGCTNLRNKSYCMWNEQLSKEEYQRRLKKYDLTNYETTLRLKEKFHKLYLQSLHKFANNIRVVNSTGDNLEGLKNSLMCFDVTGAVEDSKYIHWAVKNLKDVYDSGPGVGEGELMYEAFDTGIGNFRNLFTSVVYSSDNIEYSFNCHGCANLFGCIGLRGKNYCILNKQYTKEEYEKLVSKIIKHMTDMPYVDQRGIVYKYGEFFPTELSPFAYNETVAQDYFPKTKKQAVEGGYRWRDRKMNEYEITLKAENLPNSLSEISESITQEVLGCLHAGKCEDRCSLAYKITRDELSLYKKLGVPLPRLCFNCRHKERLKQRNPLKLWHRQCMCDRNNHTHEERCTNEFETSYAPDRPEIVYCEKCYQREVY